MNLLVKFSFWINSLFLFINRKNPNVTDEKSINDLNEKFQNKLNLIKQKSSSNQSIDTIKDEDQNDSYHQEIENIQSESEYEDNDNFNDDQLIKFNDFYPPVNYPVKSCKYIYFDS